MGLADFADWRRKNDISLSQIAETTKISVRYLEAIEGGKFQKLPGGAYSLSYLRQYAEAIHIDPDELIECFHGVMTAQDAPPPAPPTRLKWIGRVRGCIRSLCMLV